MKFARQLRTLERSCAEQWRGKFIHYKQLKKLIKQCRNDNQGCSVSEVEANDQKFFRQLEAEVKTVNKNFETAAMEVLAASKRHRLGSGKGHVRAIGCISFFKKPRPLEDLSAAELAAASAWCRQYAIVNAAGLRKIAKKHDKYCGGSAGSRFLQACWDSGHLQWGSFLHSPLMDELKALEELLNQQIARTAAVHNGRGSSSPGSSSPQLAGSPDPSDGLRNGGAAAASPQQPSGMQSDTEMHDAAAAGAALQHRLSTDSGAGPSGAGDLDDSQQELSPELSPVSQSQLRDDAMTCPICLEPMYQPLGLTCGHKACTECVLQTANLQRFDGPLKIILSLAPSKAACPQCRQTGVFKDAIPLKKLGTAIASRYPEEIKERADTATERVAVAKATARKEWSQRRAQQLMAPFAYGL